MTKSDSQTEPDIEVLVRAVKEFSKSCRTFSSLLDSLTEKMRLEISRRNKDVDNAVAP